MNLTLADAIIQNNEAAVATLLEKGADVNAYDQYGYTPLIECCIMNNERLARLVLSYNPDVNKDDVVGCTALYWAIDSDNAALVKLLLEHGANPNAYSAAHEPVIAHAILRKNEEMMDALARHMADFRFAEDFIHAKLLGHRFELSGYTYIVNAQGEFLPLSYEGFFLEYTLRLIQESLINYIQAEGPRRLGPEFVDEMKLISDALKNADRLREFHHRLKNPKAFEAEIREFLSLPLLILPISYEGHAITFVKYGNFLARCNRGVNSQVEETVNIFSIGKPENLTFSLYYQILYGNNPAKFINFDLNKILELKQVGALPTRSQVTGNCSWANVEASIPTSLFMALARKSDNMKETKAMSKAAMQYYEHWLNWDRKTALTLIVKDFDRASPVRKASIADMFGAILFQSLNPLKKDDLLIAKELVQRLHHPKYRFVVDAYIQVFVKNKDDPKIKAFKKLLIDAGLPLEYFF